MSKGQRHIAILCSYLHVPGGYEKAVVSLANLFIKKGNLVTLVILDETDKIFYPLDPSVKVIQEHLSFGIGGTGNMITKKLRLLKDIRKLRRIINDLEPTHVIATEYHFAAALVLGGAGKKAALLSWEHHHYKTVKRSAFWHYLFQRTYKKLDAIIGMNNDETAYYKRLNERAYTIPNFITEPNDKPVSVLPHGRILLSVTRFNHIKGIDLLMQVAAKILPAHPDVVWKVIGYGPQEQELKDFITKEKLADQLIVIPATESDISNAYREASLFVLTSRNESFGLVLTEAMNYDVPCVAFDCDTGPRHIIQHGVNGWLMPNIEPGVMYEALDILLREDHRILLMRENARKSVAMFLPDRVYEKWETVFLGTA